MNSRDEYVRKMQAKLEEWNAEIDTDYCPGRQKSRQRSGTSTVNRWKHSK